MLQYYLKPIGGKFRIRCGFDVKKLPIKLPKFYEDCLQFFFSKHSTASAVSVQSLNNNSKEGIIMWNNQHIYVDGKSVYNDTLFKVAEHSFWRALVLMQTNMAPIKRQFVCSILVPYVFFFLCLK